MNFEPVNIPESECSFEASRSGGPGGQHVNTTSSSIRLRFCYQDSKVLTEGQKRRLDHNDKFQKKLTKDSELLIESESSRSQLRNKEEALEKLNNLLTQYLRPVKRRRATKPTKASQKRRVDEKKRRSQDKNLRRKPRRDD